MHCTLYLAHFETQVLRRVHILHASSLRLGEDNNREFLFLTTLTSTTHHDLFTKRSTTRTGKVKLQNTPCYEIEVTEKKCIELYLSMLVVLFFQTTPLHTIITSTCKSGQNNFIFALCTVDILLHTWLLDVYCCYNQQLLC